MIMMKKIVFILKLQRYFPTFLCDVFENPVTVHEGNQRSIALTVAPQMRPNNKHISIKYHHFRSFFLKCDVVIDTIDKK